MIVNVTISQAVKLVNTVTEQESKIVSFGGAPDPPQPVINSTLFILIGQSNIRANFTPSVVQTTTHGSKLNYWDGSALQDLANNNNATVGQAGYYLGDEWVTRTGRDCCIVQTAFDESSATAAAQVGLNNNWSSTGVRRAAAKALADAAITAFSPDEIYVLISLGETDANGITDGDIVQADYYNAMVDLVEWINTNYSTNAGIYLIETGIPTNQTSGFFTNGYGQIRSAQNDLVTNNVVEGFANKDPKYFPSEGKMRDSIHYSDAGFEEVYRDSANVIRGAEAVTPDEVDPSTLSPFIYFDRSRTELNTPNLSPVGTIGDATQNGKTVYDFDGTESFEVTGVDENSAQWFCVSAYRHLAGLHFFDASGDSRVIMNNSSLPLFWNTNMVNSGGNSAWSACSWMLDDTGTWSGSTRGIFYRNLDVVGSNSTNVTPSAIKSSAGIRIGQRFNGADSPNRSYAGEFAFFNSLPTKRQHIQMITYLYNKWIK
jgi:hypothetical protein